MLAVIIYFFFPVTQYVGSWVTNYGALVFQKCREADLKYVWFLIFIFILALVGSLTADIFWKNVFGLTSGVLFFRTEPGTSIS